MKIKPVLKKGILSQRTVLQIRRLMTFFILNILILPSNALTAEGLFSVGQVETDFNQSEAAKAIFQVSLVYDGIITSVGTSFFVSPDGAFLTAKHVLQRYIDLFELRAGTTLRKAIARGGPQRFVLGDDQAQRRIHFYNSLTQTEIEIREIEFLAVPPDANFIFGNDFILARINRPVNHWISKFASKQPGKGEFVFTIGYPQLSRRATRKPVMTPWGPYTDSNGHQLRVTVGKREIGFSLNRGQLEQLDVAFSDADGLPGLSGSPVFNNAGDVVGIFCGGDTHGDKIDLFHSFVYQPDVRVRYQKIDRVITETRLSTFTSRKIVRCLEINSISSRQRAE
ncbi:MAG: hypothetical protein C5B49_08495 [Bdellovibrio sp.]|nr:MAG: hypothetical protein C5B49_08495 [Bdellovibrio sp.]